jgi:UDP-glucose 4-epimerase
MFGIRASAFRFGNVVGPRQTHGVGFDFIRRLRRDPTRLEILGDGRQSKSYVHVHDVVSAVLSMSESRRHDHEVFNVATGDYVTVTEIAELAVEVVGLAPGSVRFDYTGGDRGWKGDVPVVRIATDRIRGRGWKCSMKSRDALRAAMVSMIDDDARGRL